MLQNTAPSFPLTSFIPHTITTAADGPHSVTTADVDGDGDLDVLSASENDNTLAWYENDGNENFTLHEISTADNAAESVDAADSDAHTAPLNTNQENDQSPSVSQQEEQRELVIIDSRRGCPAGC